MQTLVQNYVEYMESKNNLPTTLRIETPYYSDKLNRYNEYIRLVIVDISWQQNNQFIPVRCVQIAIDKG